MQINWIYGWIDQGQGNCHPPLLTINPLRRCTSCTQEQSMLSCPKRVFLIQFHLRCRLANGSKYHIERSETFAAAKQQIIANTRTLTLTIQHENWQCCTDRRAVWSDTCTLVTALLLKMPTDAVSVSGCRRLEGSWFLRLTGQTVREADCLTLNMRSQFFFEKPGTAHRHGVTFQKTWTLTWRVGIFAHLKILKGRWELG